MVEIQEWFRKGHHQAQYIPSPRTDHHLRQTGHEISTRKNHQNTLDPRIPKTPSQSSRYMRFVGPMSITTSNANVIGQWFPRRQFTCGPLCHNTLSSPQPSDPLSLAPFRPFSGPRPTFPRKFRNFLLLAPILGYNP